MTISRNGSDGSVTEPEDAAFKFEDFEVRPGAWQLLKAGVPVPIEPKAFRVLVYLLRNRGRLVTKEELLSAVWEDAAVTDNSLTRSIASLRRQLGDDAREPRFIVTMHTSGYRFVFPVATSADAVDRPNDSVPSVGGDGPQSITSKPMVRWILGAVAAAGVIAVAWIGYRAARGHKEPARISTSDGQAPAGPFRVVQLTNLNGAISWPAFSPDGKQIAFIWDAGEHPSRGDLYVQFVGGQDQPLRLTHTRSEYVDAPTWLPNGREVSFPRCDDHGGAVYVVSALGGPERRITDIACPAGAVPPVSWTPDGKTLVLADTCVSGGGRGLVVFSMDTGAKHCLLAVKKDEEVADSGAVLSPDGKTVAFVWAKSDELVDLYTVPLAGGAPTRLTTDGKAVDEEFSPMWTADGKFLVFNSTRSGPERTWRIPAGGGEIEAETTYPGVGALSPDGSRLVYPGPSSFMGSSVWRIELSDESGTVMRKKQLFPDSSLDYAPQPSPDGREVVFESERSGHDEIWKSNADGSDLRKLTSLDGTAGSPRWSADGKWIAFDHLPEHRNYRQMFVMDAEGRNLHLIVTGDYNNGVASWSKDGRTIYFESDRTGSLQIWRHDIATGRETQVTHDGGFAAFESFDGKTLYFSKLSGGGIWSIPVNGGEVQHVTDAPHFGYWGEFAITENGIYLVDSDTDPGPSLMYYSFQTRQLKQILNLNESSQKAIPWSANFGASRDGRVVFVVLGTFRRSLVMAENLR